MDFQFSPQEQAFRQEVAAFLERELPPDLEVARSWEVPEDEEVWQKALVFTKKLAGKRWLALSWPTESGGYGATVMEQVIFSEEMASRGAPEIASAGTAMVGPVLILYGTEGQRRAYLPSIASGDAIWAQGYSEPEAGSDLASLRTRAVRDGDDYVINGQKIWTSNAHRANWLFVLARTDPDAPKHKGISFFLVDARTPGISVRPLVDMANRHVFNEVFFQDVRVPKENLVGEENRGWYVGVTLLDFERSNIAGAARARRLLQGLVASVRQAAEGRAGGGPPTTVRSELADRAVEIEVGRMISYRVASIQAAGGVPNYEASMAKLYHSELAQRLANTGVRVLGLAGVLRPGEPRGERLKGRFCEEYLISASDTVEAGTSEIQRTVMATRGLGLPRV